MIYKGADANTVKAGEKSWLTFAHRRTCILYNRRLIPEDSVLKGLSHEIFTVIFVIEWIYIGLKGNRFCFFSFKDVSSILDSNFKY